MIRILPGKGHLLPTEDYNIWPEKAGDEHRKTGLGQQVGVMMRGRRVMDARTYSARVARLLAATGLALLTTLLLVKVGANSTAAGMVFLVLVVWSATQAGIKLALFEAILCAVAFDFFFLPPYRTLRLAGVQEWVAMCSFVACCLVVGRVAEMARKQTRQAERRREDVERLYELSQEMMLHEDAEAMIHDLPRMIDRIFALSGVALYVCDQDMFYSSAANLPEGVKETMRGCLLYTSRCV